MCISESKTIDDARWSLVENRVGNEASFVYAVKTTGIFCLPGCSSRLPRRENVRFFDEPWQASAAGFLPCKRCRPDSVEADLPHAEAVTIACRMIDQAEEMPTLEQLAAAVHYSPSHFHKLFKQSLGVTPKAYAAMRRADRLRRKLLDGASVTEAVYASGYRASSRFYKESEEVLGMKPSKYRGGASDVAIHVAVASSSFGFLMIAATDKGICAIEFGDSEEVLLCNLRERFPRAQLDHSVGFQEWIAAVVAHIDAPDTRIAIPLDIQGTAFQRRVWEALRKVPAGTTTTYLQLAQSIGQPTAARAVAGACAANQLAVAIPCHRVLRSNGDLGGYRWGIERKKALLNKEKTPQNSS